jgi:transposase InsO family protein
VKSLHAHRSETFTVAELCGLFGKSKQAYYKHDPDIDLRRMSLVEFAVQFIRAVKAKDPGIGGMKVWAMYCRTFPDRDRIGRDRFCDIFDRYGFKIRRRCRVRTTDSRHNNPTYPNIVKEIIPTRFGEIIVGDITYIPLESVDGQRRFCYVSLLMDSYSKMILGSSVGMTLEAKYPMKALSLAIKHLAAHGVELSATIHHSDRGVQYTCSDYVTELRKSKMMISMTESGNPKDNAEAERINNTLKNELFKDMVFKDIGQVKKALDKAVMFYNYERPHLSLEMHTPAEAANETGRFKRQWISYRERAIDAMSTDKEEKEEKDPPEKAKG